MKKKFLMLLTALAVSSLGMKAGVTKVTDQDGFNTAVASAAAGDVIEITQAGTYKIPGVPENITIKGTVAGVKFDCSEGGQIAYIPNGATFDNVEMVFYPNANYHGFQHAGTINMNGCTLNGLFFSYGDMNFTNCTFNQTGEEYMMWDYGKNLSYINCVFNGHGKFINVYCESNDETYDLYVEGCTFNSDVSKKAALNIKETSGSNLLKYNVSIGEGNKCEGSFPTASENADGALYVGANGLWQVDDRQDKGANSNITVTDPNGITLYDDENAVPEVKVAKIDDVEYSTLGEAIAAVPADATTTITLMESITMIKDKGVTIAKDKDIILELNGKTLAGSSEVIQNGYSFSLITNSGTLTIQDSSSEGTGKITYTGMRDDKYKNATSNTITNFGTLTVKSGTIENWTEDGMAVYAIDNNSNVSDAILNIEGGTIYAECEAIRQFAQSESRENSVTISNGTVYGKYGTLFIQDTSANQNHKATTTISGGTLKSDNQPICRFFASSEGARCENMTLTITGGDFNTAPVKIQYNYNYTDVETNPCCANINISGGTFASDQFVVKNNKDDESYVKMSAENVLAEGYELKENPNGTFGPVEAESYVCEINGTPYPSLAAAVAAVPANGEEVTIKMIDDENILGNAGVTINAGQNIVLDLNGKTVKNLVNENKGSQVITNKGTLTIKDSSDPSTGIIKNDIAEGTTVGEWWSDPKANYATNVITNCGTLIVEGGEIYETAAGSICYAIDNNSSAAAAILTVNGGYIHKDSGTAVRQFCNSTTLDNTVNVNGGIIKGGYAGIWIQLPGSSGQAKKAALNVTGGTLEGQYAFYDYSFGDTFPATQYNLDGGTFEGNVFSYGANVAITDGDFKGEVAIKQTSPSTVSVSGGTFASDVYTYGDNASTGFITGGTFAAATYFDKEGNEQPCEWTKCLAEGYELHENGNGTYGPVEAESYVCEIGGTKYPSLAAAVAAVPANGEEVTIKMIDNEAIDVAGSGITIAKDQNIKLDLNGFTIAGVCSTGAGSNLVVNNGTLVVEDNSEEKTGKMTYGVTPAWVDDGDDDYSGSYASNLFKNYGKLTINSGYYENAGEGSACYVIDNYESGEVVLNDGYFKAASTAIRLFYGNGGLVIEDGTVEAVAGYDVISFSGSTSANSIEINGGDFIAKKGGFNVYAWAEGANSESSLTVTDGTFNAWVANSAKFSDNISIEGGDIYGFWSYNPEVKEVISGGTFTCAPGLDYLAEDCALSVNEDGTYSPIVCEESETITYYVGNNEKVDATFAEWKEAVKSNPNTIVVVDKELEGFAMANVNVVVEDENGNYCPYLALTDLSDFYSPVDFTATEGEYARENTSGLNSVCMPFELSVEDVNGVIGVVYSDATRAGEVVTKVEFTEQDNVVPGTPCIVKSSSNAWNIDLTGRQIVGSLKDDYVDSPALKGSFTTKGYYEISTTDNSYKISSDGTVFVQCIEGSQVFPFRACFDMGNSEASKSISISWRDNGTTDILLPVEDGTESEIFDIMGRRVSQPMKGGMYIVNGQKIVY